MYFRNLFELYIKRTKRSYNQILKMDDEASTLDDLTEQALRQEDIWRFLASQAFSDSIGMHNMTMRKERVGRTIADIPFDVKIILISILYACLLTVGTVGNAQILYDICRVLRRGALRLSGTLVYLVALCAMDLITCLSVIPVITYQLTGSWLFTSAGCKLQLFVESTGKAVNAYVLLAMAFERCVAVVFPSKVRFISKFIKQCANHSSF